MKTEERFKIMENKEMDITKSKALKKLKQK